MASSFSVSTIFKGKDRMSPVFNKMSNRAKMFGGALKSLIGPLAAAFSVRAIGRFANESIKAWQVQEAAIASVNATLESTSQIAGRSLQQLENQAKSIQDNTFIGDEAVLQGVTAQLLTFTNVAGTAFDRTQQAAVDVAAKLNGLNTSEEQLKSTTLALGKALNDPVANLGALSRSGIQFSAAQKEMIKGLVETNQLAKAQDIILTEIEKQYGGTAAAIAATSGGIEKSVQNAIGDTKELIGKGFAPIKLEILKIVNNVLPKLRPVIEKVTEGISKFIPLMLSGFRAIKSVIDRVTPGFKKIWNAIKGLISTVVELVQLFFKDLIPGGEKAGNIFDTFANIITFVVKTASTLLGVLKPLMPVIKIIGGLILAVVVAMKAWAVIQTIINFLITANPIGLIIAGIAALIAIIILVVQHWDKVKAAFISVWEKIKTGVTNIWNNVKDFFGKIRDFIVGVWDKIKAPFEKITELFKKEGASAMAEDIKAQVQAKLDEKGLLNAPNQREAEARQQIQFEGNLNINGAPDGSTIDSTTTGAPPIRTQMMGSN